MMEHIRQFDWNATNMPDDFFVDEVTIDNSTIEKIIRNKFCDPLVSSEDEDPEPNDIDWDAIFKPRANKSQRIYVPGLRTPPQYPKLSVLTGKQHHQMLKVLCAKYPSILEQQFIHKPSIVDRNVFETLKPIYEKEQKEFIEWAKSLWTSQHCIRALRPKPEVETVYESEFKIRAHRMSGYPVCFDMAAQIPLECTRPFKYDMLQLQTLLGTNKSELPLIDLPEPILKHTTVLKAYSRPEPCHKHPYQFILPNENSVSILPITELHRELARYAAENGAKCIASENAFRCLMELNRHWTIPITVCKEFTSEGNNCNVVVLDSEFSTHKECAMTRTFRAMRHLLENTLIPGTEIDKMIEKRKKKMNKEKESKKQTSRAAKAFSFDEPELSSDDEKTGLVIFDPDDDDDANDSYLNDLDEDKKSEDQNTRHFAGIGNSSGNTNKPMASSNISVEAINDIIGVYNCSCTDTRYEFPPRRSFKKWRVMNKDTSENIDMIVHCAHKARSKAREVIIEPIPEYQLEMGGSEQSPDRIRALTLALLLRQNADIVNVRLDACNGEMVTIDTVPLDQFMIANEQKLHQVMNIMHTTVTELQALMPGEYLLQHEPGHGANAFLHVARKNGDSIRLDFDVTQLAEQDEAKMIKTPPTIAPVLMPHHKFRKTLPCAFTPFEDMLAKDQKKPAAKQKQPPQAIKYPKRKGKKKNKK